MRKCKFSGCFQSAVCVDGRCAKHTGKVKSKAQYSKRSYPRTEQPHLGIEIECFAPDETVHRVLLAQSLTPHSDGSLPSMGCEFKICAPVKQAVIRAHNLCGRLSSVGARVNRTCGLHVHIDARNVYYNRKQMFINWLYASESFWFALIPESRRNGKYCQSLGRWLVCGRPQTVHLSWANISPYQTIEIRLHPGSINPHKVGAWMRVCNCLMELLHGEKPFPHYFVENRKEWMRHVFSDRLALEYVQARLSASGSLESYEGGVQCAD